MTHVSDQSHRFRLVSDIDSDLNSPHKRSSPDPGMPRRSAGTPHQPSVQFRRVRSRQLIQNVLDHREVNIVAVMLFFDDDLFAAALMHHHGRSASALPTVERITLLGGIDPQINLRLESF